MDTAPPSCLDGAKVKLYARLGVWQQRTGATSHSVTHFQEVVANLAIARYGDDTGVYLFYCTEGWEVVADTYHPTEQDALAQARSEFTNLTFVPTQLT